tara:strand:- start:3701 stop:3982 length:282 start_codon:yes stop_codon:yes gene_type:complete
MFENTNIVFVVAILIVVYLWCYSNPKIVENLRIQGSLDIRGDPPIGNDMRYALPFNVGTSNPIYNRRMIIGSTNDYPQQNKVIGYVNEKIPQE